MNAARFVTKFAGSFTRTSSRSFQTTAPLHYEVTSATSTTPSAGLLQVWRTLQQGSWVTKNGHSKSAVMDTFSSIAEEKTVLGTRNLGFSEKILNSRTVQSTFRPVLEDLKFPLTLKDLPKITQTNVTQTPGFLL